VAAQGAEVSDFERTDSATDELREEVDDAGDAVARGADKAKEG
jgi:hypothetical protein